MPEVTNGERARWAQETLTPFANAHYHVPNPLDTERDDVVQDFLCDLMHFGEQSGCDFDELLSNARGQHAEEVAEEDD